MARSTSPSRPIDRRSSRFIGTAPSLVKPARQTIWPLSRRHSSLGWATSSSRRRTGLPEAAIIGDNLAMMASHRGVVALVTDGMARDTRADRGGVAGLRARRDAELLRAQRTRTDRPADRLRRCRGRVPAMLSWAMRRRGGRAAATMSTTCLRASPRCSRRRRPCMTAVAKGLGVLDQRR